jgi:secondary thiamine-phosphate synthase enzyme
VHRTAEHSITAGRRHVVEITDEVRRFVAEAGTDGVVVVFVPHATCGVALIETGSGSEEDLEELLGRVLPRDDRYAHRHGSRGHGGDHLLPAFVSPSVTIPVQAGELRLGTWQSIVLVDPNEDNPDRRVVLTFLD